VGSGIAGLGCAYFLRQHAQITLFEKNNDIGGHTNTVTVERQGLPQPIDTGFMVFNHQTYPNLLRFFNDLQIPTVATDMSFSVQHRARHLEWNGRGWNQIFGQRRNLLNPGFWQMLFSLKRFCEEAVWAKDEPQYDHLTIEAFAQERAYGEDFLSLFLLPMSAAIWSTDPERMRAFPIGALLRFFHNHGFLGMDKHLQWYTVQGGAQTYVRKLLPMLEADGTQVHRHRGVRQVIQSDQSATVVLDDGTSEVFDKVIMACHADEALALLAQPTELQRQLLSPFTYEQNTATLHTDSSVLPERRRVWAAWNYRLSPDVNHPHGELEASTHYWMNRLQHIPGPFQFVVSINGQALIDPSKVLKTIHYTHPRFTVDAIAAQPRLPDLNSQNTYQSVYFCGSYFRYGFHEDAFTSALHLSRIIRQDAALWATPSI
jgi:predicted NAD/FAD-binding protein